MQACRRWRAWVRLKGEEVRDRARGGRKFKVGSVHDSRCERTAAGHVNGLSPVMGLVPTGAAGGTSLGAAEVFGARKLVAGIVDYFVGLQPGRSVGTKAVNLPRNNDGDKYQECFQ